MAFQFLKETAMEVSQEPFVNEYENHIAYKMQIQVKSYKLQFSVTNWFLFGLYVYMNFKSLV